MDQRWIDDMTGSTSIAFGFSACKPLFRSSRTASQGLKTPETILVNILITFLFFSFPFLLVNLSSLVQATGSQGHDKAAGPQHLALTTYSLNSFLTTHTQHRCPPLGQNMKTLKEDADAKTCVFTCPLGCGRLTRKLKMNDEQRQLVQAAAEKDETGGWGRWQVLAKSESLRGKYTVRSRLQALSSLRTHLTKGSEKRGHGYTREQVDELAKVYSFLTPENNGNKVREP